MALLSESWIIDILLFSIGTFTIIYWFLRWKYSYWEQNGFKTIPDFSLILGHFKKLLVNRMSFTDFTNALYKSTNEPFVGIYGILKPMVFVRDPELIQHILIKDFSPYFTDRMYFKISFLFSKY